MDTKIINRFQAQCAKREYCVKEIRAKALKALEGDAASADELVRLLVEDRFVDDRRYASAFARDKASLTGWGPLKIRFALRAKGVSEQDISAALSEVDGDRADERRARLAQTKMTALAADPRRRLKLLKFLLGRGYEYDAVEAAVARNADR
ncbi:MAG: RecX family transcriptional regulator [Bacteroidales bacterium]|nr:RecX family transcriptional regulator [Bacteroidales bacterium]